MHSQHLPMTIAEFEIMPWKLGWKYEYWDGHTHITPRHHFATASINTQPISDFGFRKVDFSSKNLPEIVTSNHSVREKINLKKNTSPVIKLKAVGKADEALLIAGYLAAFRDTIEYCDWKTAEFAEEAERNIKAFLAGNRGVPLSCSQVAIFSQSKVNKESVIGAALVVQTKSEKTLLDMLFVIPEWQRKGIATTLVSSAINELYQNEIKTLFSRYHLGNEQSRAWHQKFGFIELPDLSLARLYYHHVNHELWRRQKIGDLSSSEREYLISEVKQWKAQVDELEAIAEREFNFHLLQTGSGKE